MLILRIWPLFLCLFLSSTAKAETSPTPQPTTQASHVRFNANAQIEIEYATGQDPQAEAPPLSVRLFVLDSISRTWANVPLQAPTPPSEKWRGSLRLDFSEKGNANGYNLEVYTTGEVSDTPPESLLKRGLLTRRPYYIFQEGATLHMQVDASLEPLMRTYNSRLLDLVERGILSRAKLGALMEKMRADQLRMLKQSAAEAEERRQKQMQSEQEKLLQRLAAEKALSEAKREQRKKQAAALAAKGLEDFQASRFVEAEKNFRTAAELDPENSQFNYQRGVTLFKLKRYTDSLAILDLANDPSINGAEKQYYRGLNLLQIHDLEQAWKEFRDVVTSKDPDLAPSAAFYMGIIDFQREKFDQAKKEFEWVIDHSKDPQLDQQSDNYIGKIAAAQAFLDKKSKRWTTSLNGGITYDSNILNLGTNNSASNLAGLRTVYSATAEYRLIYEEARELAIQASFSDVYSTNTGLTSNSSFRAVDPQQGSFYLPYRWRGRAFGTEGQFTFSPGYEQINMDLFSTGTRSSIVNSYVTRLDWTFLENENRLEIYSGELRRDVSSIPEASADNFSAYKGTLSWNNTFFRDRRKETAWLTESSLAVNLADGANQSYDQINLAGGYSFPWGGKDALLNAKLGLSYSTYPTNAYSRSDNAIAASSGWRKLLTSHLSAITGLTYSVANSTLTSYAYSKYTVSAALSWTGDF